MGRLIDADKAISDYAHYGISHSYDAYDLEDILTECPTVEAIPKAEYEARLKADIVAMLDKIRAEILDCLKALEEIEKFNIYLPNEIAGRRATYQQCLRFIDKYKAEREDT